MSEKRGLAAMPGCRILSSRLDYWFECGPSFTPCIHTCYRNTGQNLKTMVAGLPFLTHTISLARGVRHHSSCNHLWIQGSCSTPWSSLHRQRAPEGGIMTNALHREARQWMFLAPSPQPSFHSSRKAELQSVPTTCFMYSALLMF